MRLEVEPTIVSIPPLHTETQNRESSPSDPKQALNEGIRAAQAGDRGHARSALLRAVGLDPRCENGWLWLASISEYPEELLVFLNNVLDINPENARASEWMRATKALMARTLVQRGIDAMEDRNLDLARECFNSALEHDQRNPAAWQWMAELSESSDEKISCLEQVLAVEADNAAARTALAAAQNEVSDKLLADAKAFAVGGRRAEALDVLHVLIEKAPACADAWILKSHLVESFEEKLRCFENVLAFDPQNAAASAGRESLLMFVPPTVETEKPQTPSAETALNMEAPEDHDIEMQEMAWIRPADLEPEVEAYAVPAEAVQHVFDVGECESSFAETHFTSPTVMEQTNQSPERLDDTVPSHYSGETVVGKKTILVVDDSPTVRKLISGKLEKCGHEVFCCNDGVEAMEMLEGMKPDLVLLDITMPRMDGYQVCKLVRNSPATKDVPVVMISGKDGFFDKTRGRMAGATGYITKPFGPETLMKSVELYLSGGVQEME